MRPSFWSDGAAHAVGSGEKAQGSGACHAPGMAFDSGEPWRDGFYSGHLAGVGPQTTGDRISMMIFEYLERHSDQVDAVTPLLLELQKISWRE
ncbi:hypothetical protein GCM10027589_11160 [Actinocorallia lasiicapitis]